MPKIIKSGINYIPEQVQPDENTIIINSEGKLEAQFPVVPQPDEVTIKVNSEGKLEAQFDEVPNANWTALEGSEGFIENKPYVNSGTDYNQSGVVLNAGNSVASGINSVAEGESTTASGNKSHAEGTLTTASGESSHAEGEGSTALAKASHAEGLGTITPNIIGAHVQGRYNANLTNSNFIDVVGYGTNNNNRKNISALTTDGRLILANSITIGADAQSQGGITIPIPSGLEYGYKYALSYDADNEQLVWEVIDIEEDPNKYSYSNATTSNPGPFTIYEGTTEPSSSLGKPGDIYFKHN